MNVSELRSPSAGSRVPHKLFGGLEKGILETGPSPRAPVAIWGWAWAQGSASVQASWEFCTCRSPSLFPILRSTVPEGFWKAVSHVLVRENVSTNESGNLEQREMTARHPDFYSLSDLLWNIS